MTEFNPMQDMPTNDEQAEIALRYERPASIVDSLCGIYRCRRTMGATVLEAFEVALKAHVDAYRRIQQTHSKSTDEPAKQTWWAGYEYIDTSQMQKELESE